MAFVKTYWVDNSEPAITAAQLNRIEDGIAEAGESSKAIVLTQAEYDALSDAEKDSDNVYYISDAPFDLPNVVTCTSTEYAAMSDATKMDGRLYYVTDEAEVAKSLVVQQNVNSSETVPSSAVVYSITSGLFGVKTYTVDEVVAGTMAQQNLAVSGYTVIGYRIGQANVIDSAAIGQNQTLYFTYKSSLSVSSTIITAYYIKNDYLNVL